ncbi:hypothetical protein [Ktedonobacter robiniae]|uniref:Opine dehydrogenase domain-containing protein n=1 Tax=Ktedonobacter robiniae TaxID=2778365 RepID=A0ABQ3V443_9CHLR|nr:hypothetical protein [Ktedonobacter robiniae]GHO59245.1 hypothetical protein KSB_77200 [Ktedonobacter robiniae]
MNHRILFVGLGNLGSLMLDLFLRIPGKHQFLVGGRQPDRLQPRVNLSLLSALQLGYTPEVGCRFLDLNNIEQVAETIAQFQPTIVVCAATRQRLGGAQHLPQSLAAQLARAPMGPRLPLHLSLVYKLMQAVKLSETKPLVLNAIYPDVIHPILQKVGLAPTTGVGDLANNVPAIKLALASYVNQPLEQVDVRLIMARAVSYRMSRASIKGLPFHITLLGNGEDITPQVDVDQVFKALLTTFRRTGGDTGLLMTAASAMAVFNGMVKDTHEILHAPGPCGLPGGYPVAVHAQGIDIALPRQIHMHKALLINQSGLRLDGIEGIEEDGTVVFTDEAMTLYRDMLGYECNRMPLSETEEWATELQERYLTLASLSQ